MGDPTANDATFRDLQLPRAKAIQYLTRVCARMITEVERRGVPGAVARMEIAEPGVVPRYRFEQPNGERVTVWDGKLHKRVADDEVAERRISWSSAAMSHNEISRFTLSLISDEIHELTRSDPSSA